MNELNTAWSLVAEMLWPFWVWALGLVFMVAWRKVER